MLRGKRYRDPGLPDWPRIFINRRGIVTVTGRHATVPRYRLVRAALRLLTLAGLISAIALGFCLVGKTSGPFNRLQYYRLTIDHFLIYHEGDLLRQLPWRVVESQLFAGDRLNGLAWLALGTGWLLLCTALQWLNRPLFSGRLLTRRTTVKLSASTVIFYRPYFVPRRFQRDQVSVLQFKVEPAPGRANDPALQNLYQDSGRLVMVYGSRVEPIATMIGAQAAGQFADCCSTAAVLARTLKRPNERRLE